MDKESSNKKSKMVANFFMDELDDLLLDFEDEWQEPFELTGSLADAYNNTMF